MPTLRIVKNKDKEVEKIVKYLNDPKFPQLRKTIFNTFPKLQENLEKDKCSGMKSENEIVELFVADYYETHRDIISSIIVDIEYKINTYGTKVLHLLAESMDYVWQTTIEYTLVPTILPFSPFGHNTFFFSMTRRINGVENMGENKNHDVLPLLAHEVSHMLLRDVLYKYHKRDLETVYSWTTMHMLQEILAPIIMNEPLLKEVLDIQNYSGNPYLELIMVSHNDFAENIVSYFTRMYHKERIEHGRSFIETILKMATIIETIEPSLASKLKLWNSSAHLLKKDATKREEFGVPIVIPKGHAETTDLD